MRLLIAGWPRTGKTTLALSSGLKVRHTDDLIETHGWSEASEEIARWFDVAGPWCIEGVAVVRALRKWLAAHPEGPPCDKLIWLRTPHEKWSAGQSAMGKGAETIFGGIRAELLARGVMVEER